MTITTLQGVLDGAISVEIGLRTRGGVQRVARGRLVDGRSRSNRVRLVDENTHRLVEVALTKAHTVAYTPTKGVA